MCRRSCSILVRIRLHHRHRHGFRAWRVSHPANLRGLHHFSPNMRSIGVLTEFQGIGFWWPLPRSSGLVAFAADQLPGTLCRGSNMRSIGVLTEFQGIGFLIMLKGLQVLNGRSCKPSLLMELARRTGQLISRRTRSGSQLVHGRPRQPCTHSRR